MVRQHAPLLVIQGRVVLVGDGMKQAKEGRRMPGVKRLHQESENDAKGEYIFGHLFGAIGILVGDSRKWFCLPLFMNLQDGVQTILGWKKSASEVETPSHVVQMIEQGFEAAKIRSSAVAFGSIFLVGSCLGAAEYVPPRFRNPHAPSDQSQIERGRLPTSPCKKAGARYVFCRYREFAV